MRYKRFDRHELMKHGFLLDYHTTTISLAKDYIRETMGTTQHPLLNMLNGIWDGFLYDELLTKALILPTEDYRRVEDIVTLINEHIELEKVKFEQKQLEFENKKLKFERDELQFKADTLKELLINPKLKIKSYGSI